MRLALDLSGLLLAGVAACSSTTPAVYEHAQFDTTSAYSHAYAASASATCEAARRALLSQGYRIISGDAEAIEARKSFQHDPATHIEIEFHVVCTASGHDGGSLAFVNALLDRYALKKSASSASVGVGGLGALSLPFGSSDDALVKVASETISAVDFYDRFFGLLARYLLPDVGAASTSQPHARRAA